MTKQEIKDYGKKYREDKSLDPEWVEKEKTRQRLYKRKISYRTNKLVNTKAVRNYNNKFPEKSKARNAIRWFNKEEGFNLHHWSYNEKDYKDVIKLKSEDHSILHRYLKYDRDSFFYKSLSGELLDTKEKHTNYLISILKNET